MSTSTHHPRIFIVCAPQDGKYQELIATKARNDRLPLGTECMIDGRTDDMPWQLECRRRIRASSALVVLVSSHTRDSARAMWQVACAREEGKPIVGITVGFEETSDNAPGHVVDPMSVIGWRWKNIVAVLMRLATSNPPAAGAGGGAKLHSSAA